METVNGMGLLVDWVSVTFHYVELDEVKALLGLADEQWAEGGFRQKGYLFSESLNGITISHGSNHEGMVHTVNLSVSGTGCRYLETKMADWSALFAHWLAVCDVSPRKLNFTRLDLAIDDQRLESEETLTIKFIKEKVKRGECRTRFRKIGMKESWKIKQINEADESYESVLNLGSRSSEVFIRVYDKRLEQLAKLKQAPKEKRELLREQVPKRWLRLELELKGNHANKVAEMIVHDSDMGALAFGILNNNIELLDVKLKANGQATEKKLWQVNPLWRAFIGEVENIKLCTAPRNLKLEQKILYIEKAHGKTLAMIHEAEKQLTVARRDEENKLVGVSRPKILQNIILESRERLDHQDQQMVAEYVSHHQVQG